FFQFYVQHLLLEQQQCQEALTCLEGLQQIFPSSSYVLGQMATAHYHMRS
ncbi:unnamed protein product, partial [Choristocarpus tenellus]